MKISATLATDLSCVAHLCQCQLAVQRGLTFVCALLYGLNRNVGREGLREEVALLY